LALGRCCRVARVEGRAFTGRADLACTTPIQEYWTAAYKSCFQSNSGQSSAASRQPTIFLHTYTGFGSVPYWNSYVAVTQIHGKGTFFDARLADAEKFPVAAKLHLYDVRSTPDLVTPKLAALQVYELSLAAPPAPAGSFDAPAALAGKQLFEGKARCASCHVPPLFTEPGENLHTADELGIDDFQARRGPTNAYRTTPLKGLWTHAKGGYYHDVRFATLDDVIDHYGSLMALGLAEQEKLQLKAYLLSL
jgi:hypothetical protein